MIMSMSSSDWDTLQEDCKMVHECSDFMMVSAKNRKDRKAQKRIEGQRRQIDDIYAAAQKSLGDNPGQTKEQLTGSIIAILLPWVLPLLRDWLLSAFQRLIVNWLLNRLKSVPLGA